MKYRGKADECFEMLDISNENCDVLNSSKPSELSLLWFQSDGNQLRIDHSNYTFEKNEVICLTEFNLVEPINLSKAKLLRWNKHFYCVINHDSEVGCKGILFYGAATLPVIKLSEKDLNVFSTVWKMLELEMISKDSLQEEMLQMMLKRILIFCTRMYKEQTSWKKIENINVDIIREYNFLVEQHFKQKHTVAEYADLLYKSPKTLSNLFKKLGSKSPLQFIKDRKMLEARRLLVYTDKSVSEIGYELGFADVPSFSRFFKKEEGQTPVNFQKIIREGKN